MANILSFYGTIYLATNVLNGKCYCGQTIKSLERRKRQHINGAFNTNNASYHYVFHQAIREFGVDAFTWEVIDVAFSPKELNDKEIHYIKLYDSTTDGSGYNSTKGGTIGVFTDEVRKRMSDSGKGKSKSIEHRKRISATRKRLMAEGTITMHDNSVKAFAEANLKNSIGIKVFNNGELIGEFASLRELERELGLNRRSVKRVLDGEKSNFKGYTFEKVSQENFEERVS